MNGSHCNVKPNILSFYMLHLKFVTCLANIDYLLQLLISNFIEFFFFLHKELQKKKISGRVMGIQRKVLLLCVL